MVFDDEACTANAVFIDHSDRQVYIMNLGNQRCVIGKNGLVISPANHIPENDDEFDRIFRAGKTVFGKRLMGNLNFSRGFGEHRYKDAKNLPQAEQALSAKPEIM